MIKGGQRIATATGVMLADPDGLGNALKSAAQSLFDPNYWSARGELEPVSGGRGSAWFIGPAPRPFVLRHYRRGGFIARVSLDRYWWLGEDRVRAFAEWRLLDHLVRKGLRVPKPAAAGYRRDGATYRCDLITERIRGAQTLSTALAADCLAESRWRAIGTALARLHGQGVDLNGQGVDHADLNAHNILLDGDRNADGGDAAVSVIDFDRARLRSPGAWAAGNLQRLRRSLLKIAADLPPGRFTDAAWNHLLAAYRAAYPAGHGAA
jgi:3-deoxy-D-manno-octulosonic acid kinase